MGRQFNIVSPDEYEKGVPTFTDVKNARIACGLNQWEAAEAAGARSAITWRAWEQAERVMPLVRWHSFLEATGLEEQWTTGGSAALAKGAALILGVQRVKREMYSMAHADALRGLRLNLHRGLKTDELMREYVAAFRTAWLQAHADEKKRRAGQLTKTDVQGLRYQWRVTAHAQAWAYMAPMVAKHAADADAAIAFARAQDERQAAIASGKAPEDLPPLPSDPAPDLVGPRPVVVNRFAHLKGR